MAVRFEYRLCTVINHHVAIVNNEYVGRGQFARLEDSLAGCLPDWHWLQEAGADGWELVAVTPAAKAQWHGHEVTMEYLYLKRALD